MLNHESVGLSQETRCCSGMLEGVLATQTGVYKLELSDHVHFAGTSSRLFFPSMTFGERFVARSHFAKCRNILARRAKLRGEGQGGMLETH